MSTHRFRERTNFTGSRVDLTTGKVSGVLLCGHTSANGRDYPPESLKAAVPIYENAKVFLNHADSSTVERLSGWIDNVRYDAAGLRGDFNALMSHPNAAHFLEVAARNPSLIGFSHVVNCKTRRKNGRDVIESITGVESVDLVVGPATTKGFFESTRTPGSPMNLSEYIAAGAAKFPTSQGFRALSEMDAGAGMMPADTAPMADATSDTDPVKTAFVTAMHGLVDQYDSGDITDAELVSKLKDVLKAHVKLSGKETPAENPPADAIPKESSDKKIAQLTVENMALKAGVTLSEVQSKALLGLADDADRKTLIESFKVKDVAGSKPTSGERGHVGKPVTESAADAPPTDGKLFAERLNAR